MTADNSWVVWYRHWYHHDDTIMTRQCDSRKDAYESASSIELDAEDCVNRIIGIEGPDGFIDLTEYHAIKDVLADARYELWKRSEDEEQTRRKRTVVVSGPCGHDYSETWTDKFFDKYYRELVERFGADRVTIKEVR